MKKNMLATMERLRIDDGIRGLLRQMWKHRYKTRHSCSGHGILGDAYISFLGNSGDGWFENEAGRLGWKKKEMNVCCYATSVKDIRDYKSGDFNDWEDYCKSCGNGLGKVLAFRK